MKTITEKPSNELLIAGQKLVKHGFITTCDDLLYFFDKPYKWFEDQLVGLSGINKLMKRKCDEFEECR